MKKIVLVLALFNLIACSKLPVLYSLEVKSNPIEGGNVIPESEIYEEGSSVTISAFPKDDYKFEKWSGAFNDTTSSITIIMDSDKVVIANFMKKNYPLKINIIGKGEVQEKILNGNLAGGYQHGVLVELKAIPAPDWEFSEWKGDIKGKENPTSFTVENPISIDVIFKKKFKSKIPYYGKLNQTSSTIINNIFHPGELLTAEEIYNKIDFKDNCDCEGCGCDKVFNLFNGSFRYLDFNNDNKPDVFGFLLNNSRGYAVGYGKYFLIDDVLGDFKIKYFDAETWFGARISINDFNGDGRQDALISSSDDHSDGEGGFYTDRSPLKIIYFNEDGSYKLDRIGPNTSSASVTTGDFDNDGDIDIINLEWWLNDGTPNHPEVPLFYINDGSGNFTITNELYEEANFYIERELNYVATGAALFDLDNDGFLDLVLAGNTNSEFQYCEWDMGISDCYTLDYNEDIKIFWGGSSGSYSESNSHRIKLPKFTWGTDKVGFEFGFIDYDNDGFFDLVHVGEEADPKSPNSGGFIEIFKNNGDRKFSRVTKSIIDKYEWDYKNCCVTKDDIPIFYDVVILDKDNDGDYDILPYAINYGALGYETNTDEYYWFSNIGKDFFWENVGGRFVLRHDKNDFNN